MSTLPSFQQYQLAFTQHLRDPKQYKRPIGAANKGIAVYEEIVFNNIFESVSACFPVAQKVLGKRAWQLLVRSFFRDYSADSPIFRQIPEAFVSYLLANDKQLKLPVYLTSLCHYEWVELAIATNNTPVDWAAIDDVANLLEQKVVFNPAMQLLAYDYDVQKISSRYKPQEKISTQLLVYRDMQYNVKFMELNTITYKLLELLQQANMTGKQALIQISKELGHADPTAVIQFGLEILEDFKRQNIIFGVTKISAAKS